MISNFIQCLGLPCAGKSETINKNYLVQHVIHDYYKSNISSFLEYIKTINTGDSFIIISADEIKEHLSGYNPDNVPDYVHEDSVQLARQYIFELCDDPDNSYKVLLDGGGINGHYNLSIINKIRETNINSVITTLFFDTPIEVCLKRLENRKRKVPVEEIYKKNQKLIKCIHTYAELSDNFIRIDYFTNKYLLLDMDGTIAAYGKSKIDEDRNTDFVNCERFKWCQPVPHIINFIKENYDMKDVYIVTACPNSIAWQEKLEWLDMYFPEIPNENRMFVGNKHYKDVFIKHLAIKKKWDLKDICLIDDFHETLSKCTKLGINAIHPSNIDVITNKYTYQG